MISTEAGSQAAQITQYNHTTKKVKEMVKTLEQKTAELGVDDPITPAEQCSFCLRGRENWHKVAVSSVSQMSICDICVSVIVEQALRTPAPIAPDGVWKKRALEAEEHLEEIARVLHQTNKAT
jgi:hypothetical protein